MVVTLTSDELGALAFAVAHLVEEHGSVTVVTPEGDRIQLEPLLEKMYPTVLLEDDGTQKVWMLAEVKEP